VCKVCGVDFGDRYGEQASGFIHVHHKIPLSEVDEEYRVNPIEDLVPVCPNCHAVIHMGDEMKSVKEVRHMLGRE
jgi:5-methylcytosine-specific restriction protein A